MKKQLSIFWFRRDLRLNDNVGLYNALLNENSILPLFIFDSEILHSLPRNDARLNFIHKNLQTMRDQLQKCHNSSIALYFGNPIDIFKKIISEYNVGTVYANRDYEPYALLRDKAIERYLS